jgi:hypothetical protein
VLRQILDRLRSGGTWTITGLASELDVPPALVEAAIEDLVGRGYLAPVGGASQLSCPAGGCTSGACDSSAACAACSLSGSCIRGGARGDGDRRVWTLTR